MTIAANLGFPRIGIQRELKRALESFWSGKTDAKSLHTVAKELRLRHWLLQRDYGITHIPSNDFSFYDHVLDAAVMVGAIPMRYSPLAGDPLGTYFAMARGAQTGEVDVPAMEMTKWFDTNYHYIVPEFDANTAFSLVSTKAIDEFLEAKAAGILTRPVLLGPVSFLLLGKLRGASPLTLLDQLLPVYTEILTRLKAAGAEWVQLDEPMLVMDLNEAAIHAYEKAYTALRKTEGLKLLVATYFGRLSSNLATAAALPVDALHVDLVRAPEQCDAVLRALPAEMFLSAGLVDGRNIWRTDLDAAYTVLKKIVQARGTDRVIVAPSCSLLHSPVDLSVERKLGDELKSWMAFATEKVREVVALAHVVSTGDTLIAPFVESRASVETRAASPRVHNAEVAKRFNAITSAMRAREKAYIARREAQKTLGLPLLPTTTIGSFPQTKEVRAARAEFKAGKRTAESYQQFLREETERTIRAQEAIGLDVLVHGEFERNDMVEYFGEQLLGFAFTEKWVGTELRLALRKTTYHLWRCVASASDDC